MTRTREVQLTLDDALNRVRDHASSEAYRLALHTVRAVAGRMATFTTDDIWEAMPPVYIHERRLLGAVMRDAAKLGLCEGSGTYRSSRRATCHGRPVMVWLSRAYAACAVRLVVRRAIPDGSADAAGL